MNKAVVFDLDGTLIDFIGDITAAMNRVLAQEGRSELSQTEVQTLVGGGVSVLVQSAWDKTGQGLSKDQETRVVQDFLDYYLASAATRTVVYDGVFDMLKALRVKGWRIGICTNKPDVITDRVLADLGLEPLVDAVVGGDFPRRKPDGEHVLETLRRLDADPKLSFYVGDLATDVAAARNAGVPVVCVAFGYAHGPAEALGADGIIDSFYDPNVSEKMEALAFIS